MRNMFNLHRAALVATLFVGMLISGIEASAQPVAATKKVKEGSTPIPGFPDDTIKFKITQQKPPNPGCDTNIDKQLQYWFDMTLCRKNKADKTPVKFMICTMLNVNQTKKKMRKIKMDYDSVAKIWKCTDIGEVEWYPNVHLGCKEFTMTTNGEMLQGFDTTVSFPGPITDAEIASTYTDIVKAADNGIDPVTCKNMIGECKFLVPGDGAFPGPGGGGTSSYWIQNNGSYSVTDVGHAEVMAPLAVDTCIVVVEENVVVNRMIFPTGNMYTMGYMEPDYHSMLRGKLTNAPIGATVVVKFPPSTEGGRHVFTVTGSETNIELPFTIKHTLMDDADEHTYLVVTYPRGMTYPDTNSAMMFEADVYAQNTTHFPDGRVLFEQGQWMHGVHLNWVWDFMPPRVTFESLEASTTDRNTYVLNVHAVDDGTMPTSALFRYRVDGVRRPDQIIHFTAEPMHGDTVFFAATLGQIRPGARIDSCEIYVKDLNHNRSHTVVPEFNVASAPASPELASAHRLDDAVPNPAAQITSIGFAIPVREHVLIQLFDATGRPVATVLDATLEAGEHTATLNVAGGVFPAGNYFYRLQAGNVLRTRRLVVVGH